MPSLHRPLVSFTIAGLLVAAFVPLSASAVKLDAARQRPTVVPGELIVRFRHSADIGAVDAQLVRLGANVERTTGRRGAMILRLGQGADVPRAIARLRASGLVEDAQPHVLRYRHELCSAVPGGVCPNDPSFLAQQYALHDDDIDVNSGFNRDADMDLPEAWAAFTTPNANGVLLAIADDGFRLTHEDLDDLRNGANCQNDPACPGTAAAQTGFEDHGTFVAGTAAARGNNGLGVASPVMDGDVLPIRLGLTGGGGFSDASLLNAIDFATAASADVLNLSLGGPVYGQSEHDALDAARVAGMLVVASAGNEDSNTDAGQAAFPANYDLANVIAVAASNANDDLAYFSSWGPTRVDLAAPGFQIRSSAASGNSDYGSVNGTSFSAPYTAGVAALIGQRLIDLGYAGFDYRELRALLLAGADNSSQNGPLPLRGRVAAGRVNAANSIAKAPQLVAGTLGGVLVVDSIAVDDDPLIDAGNDDDALLDVDETADLVVTLSNAWQAAGTVAATLSSADPAVTVVDGTDTFPAIAAFGLSAARFRVQVTGITGNKQMLFKLDLTPTTGAVQTRYFYFEVGSLQNSVELVQLMGTNDWDEFHAWHVNVPVGATNVVFETHTNGAIDIDLLARRDARPEYMITLDVDPDSGGQTFYAGEELTNPAIVSGEFDGEELIGDPTKTSTDISGTQSGIWHLVVINYDQVNASYRIKASWDAPGAGTIRFATPTNQVAETAGTTSIQVVRSGGVGAVSVSYGSGGPGTATDNVDYAHFAGTLNWADGDTAPKTIAIPITADTETEGNETFTVYLGSPTGGADLGRYQTSTVTITGSTGGGGGGGGSGGGGMGGGGGGGGATDALSLLALGALLAARRRRVRRAD